MPATTPPSVIAASPLLLLRVPDALEDAHAPTQPTAWPTARPSRGRPGATSPAGAARNASTRSAAGLRPRARCTTLRSSPGAALWRRRPVRARSPPAEDDVDVDRVESVGIEVLSAFDPEPFEHVGALRMRGVVAMAAATAVCERSCSSRRSASARSDRPQGRDVGPADAPRFDVDDRPVAAARPQRDAAVPPHPVSAGRSRERHLRAAAAKLAGRAQQAVRHRPAQPRGLPAPRAGEQPRRGVRDPRPRLDERTDGQWPARLDRGAASGRRNVLRRARNSPRSADGACTSQAPRPPSFERARSRPRRVRQRTRGTNAPPLRRPRTRR